MGDLRTSVGNWMENYRANIGSFFNILDKVCKIVKDICKWWQTMINKIKMEASQEQF